MSDISWRHATFDPDARRGLSKPCPCGHAAYQHRTDAQTQADRDCGKHWVGTCTGHVGGGTAGACCQCQVYRDVLLAEDPA